MKLNSTIISKIMFKILKILKNFNKGTKKFDKGKLILTYLKNFDEYQKF